MLTAVVLPCLAVAAVIQSWAARPVPPHDLVVALTRAVDSGYANRVQSDWQRRLTRSAGDREAAFALATLARLVYDHADAERRFAALYDALPDRADVWYANALLGAGLTRAQRWDLAGALPFLERAATAAERAGDESAQAEALIVAARIVGRVSTADSALKIIRRAHGLVSPGDSRLLARAACVEAGLRLRASPPQADSLGRRGLEFAESSKDLRLVAACRMVLANVMEARGLQLEADRELREARGAVDATQDFDAQATAYQFSAFHRIQYGYALGDARVYVSRAITAARRSGNHGALGWVHLNLAQLALRLGDTREAARALEAARTTLESVGDQVGLAAALFVAGDAAFTAGRLTDAEASYHLAVAAYQRLGFRGSLPYALLRLSAVAAERRNPVLARQHVDSAVGLAQRIGNQGIPTDALYFEGLTALTDSRWDAAATAFGEFAARHAGAAIHYRFDALLRQAEAFAGGGRLRDAEAGLDTAFALIERIRDRVTAAATVASNRDLIQTVLANRRFEFDPDLGLATTVSRLVQGGRTESAFRFTDAERGRILWVQKARRGALGPDSVVGRGRKVLFPPTLEIAALRHRLDRSTALLELMTGRGGEPTTLFVLTRDTLMALTLPPADSVVEPIQRLVASIEGGAYPRSLARSLGQTLLDAAVGSLQASITRLIVVGDGPFLRLPFDALLLADNRPVLERFAVTLAPSARLATTWLAPSQENAPRGHVVAFGDPVFDSAAGLPRLAGSALEARASARVGTRSTALIGADASEFALKRMTWSGARVLHLATHAKVEDWGLLSSAFFLTPGQGEDGRVGPEEVSQLDLPLDLVVLSGCRTIGGVVVFGEGLTGLTSAFLEAGAKAVVASYWAVGDRRIMPLVERFYGGLATGSGAGAALHAAKIALYRSGEQPAVWAALTLTGAADVRPFPGEAR
jgi:tetratricopeptide (TPR) repeat protein